jgi:ketopantoate reductase
MKILVIGAGVIGTTYAWQLSNAGHDLSLLVRKGRQEEIKKNGIRFRCRDERNKNSAATESVY